jgi:hypothetical protein
VGAGAYYRHVAHQYVDELREFVDAAFTQEVAEARFAGIVQGGLQGVALRVHLHGAELVAPEFPSVFSTALLLEEDGTRRGDFDGQPDNDIDNGEEGAKKQERESDVEHTLPESVFGKTERLLADAKYGHVAQELEVHAPLQIAAHVGDTEKAYQVIFAIVDDGENLFAAGRRQATINLLDSSLLQAVHNLTGFSQIVHLFGEAAAGLVVKVADDTESGSDVVRHLMVEFDYIAIASHQNDAAGVASMLTIGLQDLAEQ